MTGNHKGNSRLGSDIGELENQEPALNTCFNAVKYLYFAILKRFDIKATEMAGRPSLTPLQKAKSNASRAYWKWQELVDKTPSDLMEDRVQFVVTDKVMGRPPVKLAVQQDKARLKWESAISEYRKIEQEEGLDPAPEAEIMEYKKTDCAGRPGADEIDRINKFIRRQERLIDKIQDEIDAGAVDEIHERGRPIKARKQKIKVYEARIEEAKVKIADLSKNIPDHEIIKNQINQLRVESRQLTVFLDVKHTREEAEERQAEIKPILAQIGHLYQAESDPEKRKEIQSLWGDLKSERRNLSVFLNVKLSRDEALARQTELKPQISDLAKQHKAALDLHNKKAVEESKAKAAEESKRIHDDAFDRTFKEIEDRNENLKAVYARLKEEQRQKDLEAESRELEEKIRELGGAELLKKII